MTMAIGPLVPVTALELAVMEPRVDVLEPSSGGIDRSSTCFCNHNEAPVLDVAPDVLPAAPSVLLQASKVPLDHEPEESLVHPAGVVRFGDPFVERSISATIELSPVDVIEVVECVVLWL